MKTWTPANGPEDDRSEPGTHKGRPRRFFVHPDNPDVPVSKMERRPPPLTGSGRTASRDKYRRDPGTKTLPENEGEEWTTPDKDSERVRRTDTHPDRRWISPNQGDHQSSAEYVEKGTCRVTVLIRLVNRKLLGVDRTVLLFTVFTLLITTVKQREITGPL